MPVFTDSQIRLPGIDPLDLARNIFLPVAAFTLGGLVVSLALWIR